MMCRMGQARVTGPITGGQRGWPFGSLIEDVGAEHGYSVEEFFLHGDATRYAPAPGVELAGDGRWTAVEAGTAPFTTRLLVHRPTDPDRFNGTVIVLWNNVSMGFELFFDTLGPFHEGFAVVCATAQKVGVDGLPPRPMGLRAWDPPRYGELSIPGDDYSYDIFTQVARAVGPDRGTAPIDPMAGLDVRRLVAQGASQSAGRLAAYVNAVHPLVRVFDGFLLFIYFGAPTALEGGDAVVDLSDPEVLNRLPTPARIRDDTGTPVMVVNSELEAIACYPVRQPDTDTFRYWEAAGTSHTAAPSIRARNPRLVRDLGADRVMPVDDRMNQVPLSPLYDAARHHLHRWMTGGGPPPVQPRLHFAGDPPELVRDEHGIAVGGIRLPQVDVPVACNSAVPLGPDVLSYLRGSCVPFTEDEIRRLYPDRASYLTRFEASTRALQRAGAILDRDAEELITQAKQDAR
jgi:hypothetical protein